MNNELKEKTTAILEEMKQVYLHDLRPWIIGYSGGKDSTTVVQLAYSMLQSLPPHKRFKPIYVISSDTMIENPLVLGYLLENSKVIGEAASQAKIPLLTQMIRPDVKDTFWTNVIGKGMPTPTSIRFRWCTERLKIQPSNKFIEQKVEENGEVVVLLGVRKAESAIRKTRIENREIDGYLLTPHSSLNHTYVYNPIVDLTTEDVWAYLLDQNGQNPWGGNNNELFSLYLGADSGECPFTITADATGRIATPSCGTSRFGCWICTVVGEDKSLTGFIQNGEESLQPLLNFRNWILSIRDKHEFRQMYRRDGNHYYKKLYLKTLPLLENYQINPDYIYTDDYGNKFVDTKNSHTDYSNNKLRVSTDKDKFALDLLPLSDEDCILKDKICSDEQGTYINILGYGPFNFKARKLILEKLLQMQKSYHDQGYEFELITKDELYEIEKIWDQEEDLSRRCLVELYYKIMHERLPWDRFKKPLYDTETLDEIESLGSKYDIRPDLINRLLLETNNVRFYSNKAKLEQAITKLLKQSHWHQTITEELEHDN